MWSRNPIPAGFRFRWWWFSLFNFQRTSKWRHVLWHAIHSIGLRWSPLFSNIYKNVNLTSNQKISYSIHNAQMEQWMRFCTYHVHEVEFAKIQTSYKFWKKWSIMKVSNKVPLVRYWIPYSFENLIQSLVIDDKSWNTSFNFRGFLNIESCISLRRVALANKIFIQKILIYFFTILK